MWSAIPYVTTGVALAAFIVAVAASVIRRQTRSRERMIESAPQSERGELVRDVLEGLRLDVQNLAKSQRHDLAVRTLRLRQEKLRLTTLVVVVVAVLAALVTIWTGRRPAGPSPLRPEFNFANSSVILNQLNVTFGAVGDEESKAVKDAEALYGSDPDRAIERLEEIPGDRAVPALLNDLGVLYAKKGDDQAAEAKWIHAVNKDNKFERAHLNLALLYESHDLVWLADKHFRAATSLPEGQKGVERVQLPSFVSTSGSPIPKLPPGGDNEARATKLSPGLYESPREIAADKFEYFSVSLDPGQLLLFGFRTPDKGDCKGAVRLHNEGGVRIDDGPYSDTGIDGECSTVAWVRYRSQKGEKIFVVLYDYYGSWDPGTLCVLRIQDTPQKRGGGN